MEALQIHKLAISRERLVKSFYRAWDPAWVAQVWADIEGKRREGALVGEGAAFRCFRLPRSAGCELETVLLLGKETYLRQPLVARGAWQRAMERLKQLQHPLIPPFQVISGPLGLAYVMPYCSQVLPKEWKQARTFKEWEVDLQGELSVAGLILEDMWQFRLWEGQHPLLTDFSDLRLKD